MDSLGVARTAAARTAAPEPEEPLLCLHTGVVLPRAAEVAAGVPRQANDTRGVQAAAQKARIELLEATVVENESTMAENEATMAENEAALAENEAALVQKDGALAEALREVVALRERLAKHVDLQQEPAPEV